MSEKELVVADDLVVSLEYTLRLDDDEVVDSSAEEGPLVFLQGQGEIIPGLEDALYGMRLNEEKEVVVAPDDAYGDFDEEDFDVVTLDIFPKNAELEEGMGLELIDEESGTEIIAYVAEIRENEVVLDFNHPLAGETLQFKVKIVGLRPATASELEHGHVHEDENGDDA